VKYFCTFRLRCGCSRPLSHLPHLEWSGSVLRCGGHGARQLGCRPGHGCLLVTALSTDSRSEQKARSDQRRLEAGSRDTDRRVGTCPIPPVTHQPRRRATRGHHDERSLCRRIRWPSVGSFRWPLTLAMHRSPACARRLISGLRAVTPIPFCRNTDDWNPSVRAAAIAAWSMPRARPLTTAIPLAAATFGLLPFPVSTPAGPFVG
jgi:hypothetical protein